jgi:hypothetical protein
MDFLSSHSIRSVPTPKLFLIVSKIISWLTAFNPERDKIEARAEEARNTSSWNVIVSFNDSLVISGAQLGGGNRYLGIATQTSDIPGVPQRVMPLEMPTQHNSGMSFLTK